MRTELPPLLLLAAGKSSRTGQPKGLFPVGASTWLEWQLLQFKKAGGASTSIVLGYDREIYEAACALEGMNVVVNPHPEQGPFSSLLRGLSSTNAKEPVFVLPIDVPCASASTWRVLWESLGDRSACVPIYQGRGGHPALLSTEFQRELLRISTEAPEARLDVQLRALAHRCRRVDVDDSCVLMNLNTPEEFAEFVKTPRFLLS